MQILVLIPITQVEFPESALKLISILIKICNFEIVDSENITDFVFGNTNFNKEMLTPLSSKYNLVKKEGKLFINNLGLIFYIHGFLAIIKLIVVAIKACLIRLKCSSDGCCP